MSRRKLHLDIDTNSLKEIQEALPGVAMSAIVNELLFSLASILRENQIELRKMFDEASKRTIDTIEQ